MTAPTFLNADRKEGGATTSDSLSFTPNSGANYVLGVLIFRGAVSAVSMTYGGVSMGSAIASSTGTYHVYIFQYKSPSAGASTVAASWTTAMTHDLFVCAFQDVNLADPFTTATSNSGSSTAPTLNVNSDVDTLPVAFLSSNGSVSASGATQTRMISAVGSLHNGAGDHENAGASPTVTISWTTGGSTWAVAGFSLKPAPLASSNFFMFFN